MYWDTTPPGGRTRLPALLTGGDLTHHQCCAAQKHSCTNPRPHLCTTHDVCYRGEKKASVLVTRVDTGGSLLSPLHLPQPIVSLPPIHTLSVFYKTLKVIYRK